jgi:hypothetical protein
MQTEKQMVNLSTEKTKRKPNATRKTNAKTRKSGNPMTSKQLHDKLETFKPLRIRNAVYIPAWMTTVSEICEAAGLDAGAVERWNADYYVIECLTEPVR